ncbi:MAG: cytochrome d ubiquinol oxidase subunit II [Ignavibacterium sp.]|nr:cytochrome d ubiquinol oxidase subunit II [Ignavibacterium sp.]MDW8375712.1 cytochrome d ubiquinol oxidase subunit II [Ignavibacteriales bacterium]
MEFTLDLNTVWFILIGVMLAGYAILDGFDLGIGALHLLVDTDDERRIMLNSIGPVWDGNEVWLVTGGGALFAAFPEVYATVFSGFYNAIILLLFMLIFRAVAIEFRSKRPMKWWRNSWDIAFSISSILIAFLMGIALGNIVTGIKLGPNKEYIGSFLELINPYTVLVGITTVALFMMHGAIYGVLKTEGELQNKLKGWVNNTIIFFVICYVTTTMATLIYYPNMARHFKEFPPLFIIALLNMLAIANIPREIHHQREFRAFLSSSASIAALLTLFAIGIFPNIVLSNPNPEYSLNIYNSASSEKTLTIMLIIAVIGFPFVLAYTISIYWIFRGKVKLTNMSY